MYLIAWTILSYLFVALVVERCTEIIHASKLFGPLRNALGMYVGAHKPRPIILEAWATFCKFWHSVVTCGWCLSMWVSLVFCWTLPGHAFSCDWYNNIVVKWVAVCGLANWTHTIYELVRRGRMYITEFRISDDQFQQLLVLFPRNAENDKPNNSTTTNQDSI